jgi:hypothetical protein
MGTVPDAPWIRDAEMHGVPEEPDVHCPICGETASYIYLYDGDAIGCNNCIKIREASDWAYEEEEENEHY